MAARYEVVLYEDRPGTKGAAAGKSGEAIHDLKTAEVTPPKASRKTGETTQWRET